jgi:hypothetical protein
MTLTDEQVKEVEDRQFRNELLSILERIAVALEQMEVVETEDASN